MFKVIAGINKISRWLGKITYVLLLQLNISVQYYTYQFVSSVKASSEDLSASWLLDVSAVKDCGIIAKTVGTIFILQHTHKNITTANVVVYINAATYT